MARHSKWDNIKHEKGKADAQRGKLFTRLVRNIIIGARDGGSDLETNFRLRLAVDKAKEANMPKDTIERAIKKGAGELEGENFQEIVYEAFGPNGTALLIKTVTSNVNRTVKDLKMICDRNDGNLGSLNSVKWMFDYYGIIELKELENQNKEDLEMKLMDLEIENLISEENSFLLYVKLENLEKIKNILENDFKLKSEISLEYIPKNCVNLNQEDLEKLRNLLEKLEEHEDVNDIFTNVNWD